MSRNPLTTFIVGVDPGDSTGFAVIRGDGFRVHVAQGPPHVLDDFTERFRFLTYPGIDVLVACERFVVTIETARHSSQPTALQVTGVVQLIARTHDWPFYLQTPADAKKLVPNFLLRDLGLYVTPRDVERPDANDANDAVRHALLCLAQRRASAFDVLTRDTMT